MSDIEFYYEEKGSGQPPIVFIAGYTGDHNLWKPIAEEFVAKHKVLIFDNQGIGKTKDSGQELNGWDMAKNIKGLVDGLKIEQPIIVGYAMGGNLALAYAIQYPDAISKLILVNSVAKWSESAIQYVNKLYMTLKNDSAEKYYKLLYEHCFGSAYKHNTKLADFLSLMPNMANNQKLEDNLRQIRVLETFDATESLGKIKAPTLIISSEEDKLATVEDARFLVKNIKNSRLIILEETGHAPLLENAHKVIALLWEFVR